MIFDTVMQIAKDKLIERNQAAKQSYYANIQIRKKARAAHLRELEKVKMQEAIKQARQGGFLQQLIRQYTHMNRQMMKQKKYRQIPGSLEELDKIPTFV